MRVADAAAAARPAAALTAVALVGALVVAPLALLVAALLWLAAAPTEARAQSFEQHRVRHDRVDPRALRTPRVDMRRDAAAELVGRPAAGARADLVTPELAAETAGGRRG